MPASPAAPIPSLFACAEIVFCKTEVRTARIHSVLPIQVMADFKWASSYLMPCVWTK